METVPMTLLVSMPSPSVDGMAVTSLAMSRARLAWGWEAINIDLAVLVGTRGAVHDGGRQLTLLAKR